MKIGDTLLAIGDPRNNEIEADKAYSLSLSIRQALLKNEPSNAEQRRALALSYERVGSLEFRFGHPDEALNNFLSSLSIRRSLSDADSGNLVVQRDLATTYQWMGDIRIEFNQLDEALETFSASLAIRKEIASQNPSTLAQRDLAVAISRIGNLNLKLKRNADAIMWYRQSLEIREKLAAADQNNAVWQSDLIIDLQRLALAGDEPKRHLSRAIEIAQELQTRGQLRGDQATWVDSLRRALEKVRERLVTLVKFLHSINSPDTVFALSRDLLWSMRPIGQTEPDRVRNGRLP